MTIGFNFQENLLISLDGRSTVPEKRTLRALSYQMLPQFVFEQYPGFTEFVETFLDFIEKRYSPDGTPNPGPYHILKNLAKYADLDETEEEFVRILKIKLGRDLPALTQHNLRSFLKKIKDFYLSKGTEKSIQFFFRSVFNTYSNIYLPKKDLLRVSSSTWFVPYRLRLRNLGGSDLTQLEMDELFDSSMFGQTSKQSSWLGETVEISSQFWQNILASSGDFQPGETVTVVLPTGESREYWIPVGNIEYGEGTFLTDDGMPSSTKRVQDSFYWQEFSYEIRSTNQISDIVNPLVMNAHPAGFKIFAKVEDENPSVNDPDEGEEIGLIRYLDLIICELNSFEDDEIGIIEIPKVYDYLRIQQAFTDFGELIDGFETFSIAEPYSRSCVFDRFSLKELESMETENSLIVSFDGFKLYSGMNLFDSKNLNARARVKRSKDQTAVIGIGDFSLDTLSESVLSDLEFAQVKVLSRQQRPSDILQPTSTQIVAGQFQLNGNVFVEDENWSTNENTGKLVLGFKNNLLIQPGDFTIGYIYESSNPLMTFTFGPGETSHEDLLNPPLYEFVYLEESDLYSGDHFKTGVLNSNLVKFEFSAVANVSVEDLIVFRDGKIQTAGRDFNTDDTGVVFTYSKSTNSAITVVVLKAKEETLRKVPVSISPEVSIPLPSPIDSPLEIIPTTIDTRLKDNVAWYKFSKDSFANDQFSSIDGIGFGEASYVGPGVFEYGIDNVEKLLRMVYKNEYVSLAGVSLSQFVQTFGDPFSVNVWINFVETPYTQYVYCLGESDLETPTSVIAQLKIMKTGSQYKLRASCADSSGPTLVNLDTALGAVEPNKWFMVTLRYNGSTLELIVKNGDQPDISVSTPLVSSTRGSVGDPAASYLGIASDLSPSSKFYGQIGYFGLWNFCLTDLEISQLFNNSIPLTEPVSEI